MYKVVLVDDERIIRLALASIINWEENGFTVCGSFGSAEAALEQLPQLRPQLIVTDIVMPEMDGLQFIQKAREDGYTGEFLLLTNYSDFSYAVAALQYGALDYVLKTDLTAESFAKVLQKARQKLNSLPKPASEGETVDQDITQITMTLNASLEKPVVFSRPYFFLQISLHRAVDEHTADIMQSSLKSIVEDVLKKTASYICSLPDARLVAFAPSERMDEAALAEYAARIQERTRLYMNVDCCCVLSRNFEDSESLQRSLQHCKLASSLSIYFGFGALLREAEYERYRSHFVPMEKVYRDIQKAIDNSDYTRASEQFGTFWTDCRERRLLPQDAYTAATAIENLLLINNSLWIERALQESSRPMPSFPNTMQGHIRYFNELLSLIQKMREKFSFSSCRKEVAQIDIFIHQHLTEHITLAMLSEHINMSENYLSRMFKTETGMNLVPYINLVKLEQARILLAIPENSIKMVALELGFKEQSYFNKLFKKTYGINPSDYKRLLQ